MPHLKMYKYNCIIDKIAVQIMEFIVKKYSTSTLSKQNISQNEVVKC